MPDKDKYYYALLKIYEGIDKDYITAYTEWLRSNEPQAPIENIAKRLIKRHSKKSASMGAMTSLPANIPIYGTILSIGGIGIDYLYLLKQQLTLFLEVAALFGLSPYEENRLDEFLECTARIQKKSSQEALGSPLKKKLTRNVIANISRMIISRRAVKVVPVLGILSGSVLNYVSVRKIGKEAIEFYKTIK